MVLERRLGYDHRDRRFFGAGYPGGMRHEKWLAGPSGSSNRIPFKTFVYSVDSCNGIETLRKSVCKGQP